MDDVPSEAARMLRSGSCDGEADTLHIETANQTWMSPRIVLVTFTLINFLLYFDRGAIAGALSSIRIDSNFITDGMPLSDAKSGLLVSGFTIGYVVSSPIITARGMVWGSRVIILLGLVLWCLTCLACAAAFSYASLLICRILVGVAEAAFVGFTVTIIDTIAPYGSRTSWIGLFFSAIPIGTAVGMGCGGVLSSYATFGGFHPWKLVLVLQVAAALPIIGMVFFMPIHYHLPPAAESASDLTFLRATRLVLRTTNYLLLVVGFSSYCFLMGAVSTWGIPLLHEGPLQFTHTAAALFMGLVTAFSGAVGSLLGGQAVDFFGGSTGIGGIMYCQQFNILMLCIAIPCGIGALCSTNAVIFGVAFLASVLAFFTITAPVNASILGSVPPNLRPYAASYSTFIIHLIGDFPSPTLAGLVSDYWGRNCRELSQSSCATAEPSLQCAWISDVDGGGRCVSRTQLRNALLLVFVYASVAIPCWASVWWRLRRELMVEVVVEITEDSTIPTTPG